MDVQLATVLSGGSPEVQNGSQCAGASNLLSEESKGDRQGAVSDATIAGSLRLLPINQDAVSINRTKPEVGGTCELAPQEQSETNGSRQPIRIQILVSPLCQTPDSCTKDPHFGSARKTNQISIFEAKEQRQALTAGTRTSDVSVAENILSELSLTVKGTHEASSVNLPNLGVKEECLEKPVEGWKDVAWVEEQTEPLDLSLPKKRENRDPRHGRLLDACDSLLIMEVDEYEGEGDRDVVEEDEEALPFFYPTSVLTQDLLLIDDQGIPYTLSPDGLRVPQVDIAASEERGESEGSSHLSASGGPDLSQNSPDAPNAPSGDGLSESPSTTQQVHDILGVSSSEVSGLAIPNQPIQILNMPSSSAPILLPSTPLSLSVNPTATGSSAPIFLFLSSGDSTSTPIAILDPSTGQLSQISLPLASGTALPQPVMGLGLNNSPVILSGVSSSVLASSLSAVSTSLIPPHVDSSVGTEAISAEQVSNESDKPSSLTAVAATLTLEPSNAQPPDPLTDSERLPLDDHMYFSSSAAPPSPPKLEPLDPSDSLSPKESPDDPAARRVLYCQLCPRIFFYLSDLERHAITHSQKKPHVCLQCNKAFKRSSHLQRHKHIHTGQRNFVCPICSKRFREAGELQRHQRVHTGEKPYQCQLCHTRFAERNTLRRHTKRKHPFHQVAVEMLNERVGGGAVRQGEEPAEWYSSAVSHLGNTDSETET
ncbi:zinc finger protein 398 [Corythoichthys intestinalis]|uniref:zinc finger protein 398 n=1 Tax=Corythoichthys intestinalis TaxID=161448 RepID=UPI0025A5708F|nr:zinc finger protein 398 [Corythoichthys intestinalis]XP_057691195.1 zinc finger protein 398 [Corythoichthys intestinalis]XP_057691196.1 zinc finger protein 398 [Corythoichthys intestinalis]XP_057691197.1 zinc finger protein 398 [Corythoichthys intestinalis]